MKSLKKMRVLARIMLAASVIACLAGTYITVRSVVEMIHIFSRGEAEAIEYSARDGERRPLSLNDLFPV